MGVILMIKVIDGDLFTTDARIIAHSVNCRGVMGSGVALQVHQKFPHIFFQYKKFCDDMNRFHKSNLLGSMLPVSTNPMDRYIPTKYAKQIICNLFTQENYGFGKRQTDYDAFKSALINMNQFIDDELDGKATIAMPYKIGCFRGGGDWGIVLPMIEEVFSDKEVLLYRRDENVRM